MISVSEAEIIINNSSNNFPAVECRTQEAYGKILREPIEADRDHPPFNRVMMDGIAINSSEWNKGTRVFKIEGVQGAGEPPRAVSKGPYCVEIMTGAVLPENCDSIVMIEQVTIEGDTAHIKEDYQLDKGQHVHLQGSDHRQGDYLLLSGDRILGTHSAVLASVGKTSVLVGEAPHISIISTGDELVDLHEEVKPYQIRCSNLYAIQASCQLSGCTDISIHRAKDDPSELRQLLLHIMEQSNVLILSGGVSKGKFDYVPHVLEELKVRKMFHRIRQRPGKPFWFGTSATGTLVFGLPGNPVSALVCLRRYVTPQLQKLMGLKESTYNSVLLTEDVTFKKNMTLFLPVKVICEEGKLLAIPTPTHGSGDFAALTKSDGFIELSEEYEKFSKGSCHRFFAWKQ